ncbi:UNKNOWN [Stylonychia lemnae]|uniref:Transmembrane protein n=1 Tax=Stylonychia lemnae TaxID=5949 RepID=A0A078AZX2_STYLE|nr:UNKNOWN [Stylonychia lemnae]|eukprot:CDW87960.1 UNKNOWN [Stylonychia lemnae]
MSKQLSLILFSQYLLFSQIQAYNSLGWSLPSNSQPFYLVNNMYLKFGMMLEADAGYETVYQASSSFEGNEESYTFQIYSTIKLVLDYGFLSFYQGQFYFNVEPLVIQPYVQTISWTRVLDDAQDFKINLNAYSLIYYMYLTAHYKENAKVIKKSMRGIVQDQSTQQLIPKTRDLKIDPDYQTNQLDYFLKVDLLDEIFGTQTIWPYLQLLDVTI